MVKKGFILPKERSKNPICERVVKATIFLRSNLISALKDPNKIVVNPSIIKLIFRFKIEYHNLNLKFKTIPEVTKVLECTRAEVGVGAAIAAGNQDLKGKIALLVIIIKNKTNSI